MIKMVSERRRIQNIINQTNSILRKKNNVEEYEKLKLKWKSKRDLKKGNYILIYTK